MKTQCKKCKKYFNGKDIVPSIGICKGCNAENSRNARRRAKVEKLSMRFPGEFDEYIEKLAATKHQVNSDILACHLELMKELGSRYAYNMGISGPWGKIIVDFFRIADNTECDVINCYRMDRWTQATQLTLLPVVCNAQYFHLTAVFYGDHETMERYNHEEIASLLNRMSIKSRFVEV